MSNYDEILSKKDIEIKKLQNLIRELNIKNERDRIDIEERFRKHLRYRLGDVIVRNVNNPVNFALIPFKLVNEYLKYKKEKSKINSTGIAISIVIAAYNCEKYIEQCLDSLINQTFKNFEIIVVDDGSTDSTFNILKRYEEKYKYIHILRQKNQYAGVARNNGMAVAKGKYLLFLDADDFFEPNLLCDTFKKAETNNADIVIFKAREFNEITKKFQDCRFPLSPELFPKKNVFSAKDFGEKLFQANSCIAWNKLISRDLVNTLNIKFASTRSSNDTVFIFTLLTKAKRMCLVNKVLANYRVGNPNSLQRSKSKTWESICLAFFELKKTLIKNGEYENHKRTYVNKALQACLYYLSTVDANTATKMACSLNNKYFKQLDILGNADKKGYIYNKNFYNKYKEIKKTNYIPIVYATDNNYAKYVSVSIQSIIDNSKLDEDKLLFFILVNKQFSDENVDILSRQVQSRGCFIEFIRMGEEYERVELKIEHISKETFYRLRIPSIFKFLNKLIYIDGDTIVVDRIYKLWNEDINNFYFGGVGAYAFWNKKHQARLQVDTSSYINAGVLLINNRLLIKDKLEKKFHELIEKKYDCQDQDIINVACNGKIKLLDFKYNVMTKYCHRIDTLIKENKLSENEAFKALKNPVIIHYADKVKPWNDKTSIFADVFWEYAKKTEFFQD